jgi:hypothetical protein
MLLVINEHLANEMCDRGVEILKHRFCKVTVLNVYKI